MRRREWAATLPRDLSDDDVAEQVDQLQAYLRKGGNLGASAWLTSKGFVAGDRRAILLALGEAE